MVSRGRITAPLMLLAGLGASSPAFGGSFSCPIPNPDAGFANVCGAVGGRTNANGNCLYDEGELTDLEIARAGKKAPSQIIETPFVKGPKGGVMVAPGYDAYNPYEPDWTCRLLRDNIDRDDMSDCLPPAAQVLESKTSASWRRVEGNVSFIGAIPFPYRYDLKLNADGTQDIEVRIAFRGDLAQKPVERALLQFKLNGAAEKWTQGSPGGKMHFKFKIVDESESPHFVVNYVTGDTRGPYNVRWGAEWSDATVAHEVGHMMGLDDEYDQFRATCGAGDTPQSKLHCNLSSIMCAVKTGSPKPYHYYLIGRRAYCHVTPNDWSGAAGAI